MTTAVDSMVLIDLFQQEPKWAPRAATAIDQAIRSGRLVACDVVWAEVAGCFASDDVLTAAMAELSVEFDGITETAATKAGRGGAFGSARRWSSPHRFRLLVRATRSKSRRAADPRPRLPPGSSGSSHRA